MNHEIISSIAPLEYYKAFLDKDLRPDKRGFKEQRGFNFSSSVLDSETFSCTNCLGEGNRILAVLKMDKETEIEEKKENDNQDLEGEEENIKDNNENNNLDFKFTDGNIKIITDFCGNSNLYFDETDILSFTNKLLR